ncbi:hypothetical protein RND71_005713 [Anisodus tanguticus]|uniref:Uncharacterized protein n=1 Tax=Anisodus tanguticus TaxID=243964 RepID=A0AAE1SUR9_9SOLA|nr:hypothetical protein RND71_005713 [Anisodus tanguticus]
MDLITELGGISSASQVKSNRNSAQQLNVLERVKSNRNSAQQLNVLERVKSKGKYNGPHPELAAKLEKEMFYTNPGMNWNSVKSNRNSAQQLNVLERVKSKGKYNGPHPELAAKLEKEMFYTNPGMNWNSGIKIGRRDKLCFAGEKQQKLKDKQLNVLERVKSKGKYNGPHPELVAKLEKEMFYTNPGMNWNSVSELSEIN